MTANQTDRLNPMPVDTAGHARSLTNTAVWLLATASVAWIITLSAWTLAGSFLIGMFTDSVWYLAIADYYRTLLGAAEPVYAQAAYDTSRFPPLYSALIAAVGGGIENQANVQYLTVVLNACAVLAAAWWTAQHTRSIPVALAALPVTLLTPALLNWLFVPLSEPMFLIAVVASLVAAHRARNGAMDIISVAALVSIVPLIRSAGLALVVGFAIWAVFAVRDRPWKRAAAIMLAVAPGLLWGLYRSTKPVVIDYAGEVSLARMIEEGGTLLGFVEVQLTAAAEALRAWFGSASPILAGTLAAIFAFAAIHGWWLRVRHLALDAIFVPIYLGMVLAWPYPLEMPRLLSVVMPFVAVWSLAGVTRWLRQGSSEKQVSSAAVLTVALTSIAVALPDWSSAVARALMPAPEVLEPYKRTSAYFLTEDEETARAGLETTFRILELIDATATEIEPNACIYSNNAAIIFAASRGRLRSETTPRLDPDQPILEQLPLCRYLMVMNLGSRQAHYAPLYPIDLVHDVMKPVLVSEQEMAGGRIVAAALLEK